jgi:hypothetical protein
VISALRVLAHSRLLFIGLIAILAPDFAAALSSPGSDVPDMSGEYEFLTSQNTLGILEEEGKLKGYIDVAQGEDESDTVLTFQIMQGTRQGDQVQFKTGKIHERYYRFSGTVQRGHGRTDHDADFLRLVGDLETIHIDPAGGQEHVERRNETFKWKPKTEEDGDQ